MDEQYASSIKKKPNKRYVSCIFLIITPMGDPPSQHYSCEHTKLNWLLNRIYLDALHAIRHYH